MKPRKLSVLLSSFISLCLGSLVAWSQPAADLGRSTGAPTAIYHGTDLESVDTSNGNLHISLPLLHFPGRGLDMDIVLSYNSKVLQAVYIPSPDGIIRPQIIKGYDQNVAAMGSLSSNRGLGSPGWSVGVPRMGFVFTGDADECAATDADGNCILDILHATFLANDGTRISLVNQTTSGVGSGMWSFDGSFALYTTRGLIFKDGVTASYTQNASTITGESLTDTNGNFINCSFSGGNPLYANVIGCTDTVGRHITFASDPVTGLPGSMTYTDSSGVSRTVTFQYAPFTLNYPFTDGTFCNDRGFLAPPNNYLLTSVTLANNLRYDVQYFANGDGSTTGEITKIILPTGGYIRYEYGFGPASTDGYLNVCTFQGNPQNRMVVNRFVSSDGTSGSEQRWSYSLTALQDANSTRVMTVTDPQLNSQIYMRAFGSPLPYQTDYKDANGVVVKSVRGEVESAPGTSQYLYSTAAFTNARYKSLTTILSDTNQQSKTTYTYGAVNNVIEQDETDWGNGAPGAVLRKSTFTYLSDASPAYAADAVHILDRVKDHNVCDAGSTFCSQSTTSYDSTPITFTSSNPVGQHDYTNFPYTNTLRGNPTQVSRFLNTTGTNLIITNVYNDVGNLLSVTDPKLNVTSFSYTDNYASGTPGQTTSAYVTQITRPVTNGINHIQRFQQYFSTGLTAASCGENFPPATACAVGLTGIIPDYQTMTYDRMGRLLAITHGDGGQTTLTYNESALPINIATDTKIDPNPLHDLTQSAIYDGLGRLSQTQLTSDPDGATYELITYDSLGRKSQVFNPTRCNPPGTNCGETIWGYTTFGYDALGRTKTVTSQDGDVSTSTFSGNAVTMSDQAGKKRKSISDGLGRVTQVFEDPGGLNYETDYQYDALDNLRRVDQKGSAPGDSSQWRTRLFTYNSLSQLLTASNPESGTITYAYDADGNVMTKTDARGIISTYSYDTLNRILGKSYSDGTLGAGYLYDQTGVWGPAETNTVGRLVLVSNGHFVADGHFAATLFSYDAMGRINQQWDCPPSTYGIGCLTVGAQYDLAGDLTQLTYPNGEAVKLAFDSAGRATSAKDETSNISFAQSATYGPDGSVTGFVSGQSTSFAGISNTFSYNKRLQPVTMEASLSPTNKVFSISYDFHLGNGNNGNVWGITNNRDSNRSQTFTYDQLNRLASAQNTGTDCAPKAVNNPNQSEYWGNSYGYDAWGNLQNKTVTKCSAEYLSATALANNRLSGYSYDAAGNMTTDNLGNSLTYDAESHITQANSGAVQYTYDHVMGRVRKDVSGQPSTEYYYLGNQVLAEKNLSTGNWTNYIFFGGERIARREYPAGDVFYYFSDYLKTTSAVCDSAGNPRAESDYYPWGGEIRFVDNDSNHYKFTGKERDAETSLDYFGARYYSNGLGRWVTPDWSSTPEPVPYADLGDPQTLNLYAYVRALPTTRIDADGHCCDWQYAWDFGTGAVQGWVASASHGLVGAPKSGDSEASLLGQSYGTFVEGAMGTALTFKGAGDAGVGVLAAPETGGASLVLAAEGGGEILVGGAMQTGAAKNAGAIVNAMANKNKGVEPYNRKEQYGDTSSSQAAKDARGAGEGQPCPKCGKTQESGGPHAPQAEHSPTLKQHWYSRGHKMSRAERRRYANSKRSLNGTLCKKCQGQQGGMEKNKQY